jgi:hypothetical protein
MRKRLDQELELNSMKKEFFTRREEKVSVEVKREEDKVEK